MNVRDLAEDTAVTRLKAAPGWWVEHWLPVEA